MDTHINPKLICFIGRFQPFHNGHLRVINTAFKQGDHLLVLVGSAQEQRTTRNPFNFLERESMIKYSVAVPFGATMSIRPLNDNPDDTEWLKSVDEAITRELWELNLPEDTQVCIIGHTKDQSSEYLYWSKYDKIFVGNHRRIDATSIRKAIKEGKELDKVREMMPLESYDIVMKHKRALMGEE